MEPTPEESNIPGVVGRRSARLSIIVPITLRGTDAAGHPFKENTWTIDVNKHGGRIATFHQLTDGDEIVIENPLLGRSAKASVVRICEKRFATDPYEVCIELLDAQNVWGIKFPPQDWQEERQVPAGEQTSSTLPAAPQAQETAAGAAEKGGDAATARLTPAGSPAEMGEPNEGLNQFDMAVNALSRFAGEADTPPAQPAPPRQDAGGVPKTTGGRLQTADVVTFKSLQEKIGEAQSLQQELSALVDAVQSARGEMENLLLKAHETRRDWTLETEQVAKESLKQLEEFKAQIERARSSGEDSVRQNLEKMRQEIQAETLNAGIQAKRIYQEESAIAAKAISVCVDSAVDSLNRAGDEATAKLQAARQNLELSTEKAVEEYLPRLAAESASRLEKFRAEAQTLTAQLQSQVESSAREFSEKARREISEKLEGAVEGALELVARDFNKQAEDSLELLIDGVRSAQAQCLEETQKQLAAARQLTLTSLEGDVGAKSASFREQLHTTLRGMLEQQTKEIETGMQTSLQGLLQSLRERIQATADESAARVAAEVSLRAEEALQGLADRLYKGVGMAALVAKEWEEQTKTHLEAHSRQLLEVFPKQLEALTAAAQDRQRSEVEALQGLFQSRLKQAARLFEGLETGAGQAVGAAGGKESENPPFQPSPASGSPSQPEREPLLEKQQQIIEEALAAFRSGLSQILAGHTPSE